MDIPELALAAEAQKVSGSFVDYITSTLMSSTLYCGRETLKQVKLYGASDPERCKGGIYGTSREASVSEPEKIDKLGAHQPKPTAMMCRKDRGLSSELGVLSLVGQL